MGAVAADETVRGGWLLEAGFEFAASNSTTFEVYMRVRLSAVAYLVGPQKPVLVAEHLFEIVMAKAEEHHIFLRCLARFA